MGMSSDIEVFFKYLNSIIFGRGYKFLMILPPITIIKLNRDIKRKYFNIRRNAHRTSLTLPKLSAGIYRTSVPQDQLCVFTVLREQNVYHVYKDNTRKFLHPKYRKSRYWLRQSKCSDRACCYSR